MECFDLKITNNIDTNLIYPLTCAVGLIITYFGNRFVKPTIFCLGTILSVGSSYKLIDFIMDHFKYQNCLVHAGGSLLSGLSGGFLLLKLYKFSYFVIGFTCGGSFGYLVWNLLCKNIHLGIIYLYDNMFWICIIIPGIISGGVSMYKEQELSMLTTSFIGPVLSLYSFHLLSNYYNLYVFIPVYIILSLSGLYIQHKRYKMIKELNNFTGKIQYSGKT